MSSNVLREELGIYIHNRSSKKEAKEKRLHNIQWIEKLERDSLSFGTLERQLLLHTTSSGEKIYIQFPGKESAEGRKSVMPWDFRPKVEIKPNYYAKDLSFSDVWDMLYDEFSKREDTKIIETLATVFYRMANMLDNNKTEGGIELTARDLTFEYGKDLVVKKEHTINLDDYYRYGLPTKVLNLLSEKIPTVGEMSLEAFLYLNELLVWNEDCKYYYRNMKSENGNRKWIDNTGRINTLYTHINMFGVFLNQVKFSKVLISASRMRGVAPISGPDLKFICKDYILDN